MGTAAARPADYVRTLSAGRTPEADDVDRPGACAERAQPVANRLAGHPARLPRGVERIVAQGEAGGERRGVRAARAVGGALGMPLPGQALEALAVEEHVVGRVGVTAGQDDGLRSEGVDGPREVLDCG